MIYGYARVSTSEQSTELQLQAFQKNDVIHMLLAEMFDMSEAGLRDSIHRHERRGRWKNATS